MLLFDTLSNRCVIKARLQAEGALHIGSGMAGVATDAPFVRMGNAPYIPGSSLRGTLRSTVERLIQAIRPEEKFCLNFNHAVDCASSPEQAKEREEKEKREQKEVKAEDLRFCAICGFFGSTTVASRFKISDAVQSAAKPKEPVRRDGVGIDRDTETARDQIKYDFEVLDPGCEFDVTLQVENSEDADRAILYVMLLEMKNGFDVGGKRSRGLGRMKLMEGYTVSCLGDEFGHPLKAYLKEGKLKTVESDDFERQLRVSFLRFASEEGPHAETRVA
jgi:CRISPR-associated RAMP protein (TIGR02581 family)